MQAHQSSEQNSPHKALEHAPQELKEVTEISTDELSDGSGVNINHFKISSDKQNRGYGTQALHKIIVYYDRQTTKDYIAINIGTTNLDHTTIAEWLASFGFEINESTPGHVDGLLEIPEYQPPQLNQYIEPTPLCSDDLPTESPLQTITSVEYDPHKWVIDIPHEVPTSINQFELSPFSGQLYFSDEESYRWHAFKSGNTRHKLTNPNTTRSTNQNIKIVEKEFAWRVAVSVQQTPTSHQKVYRILTTDEFSDALKVAVAYMNHYTHDQNDKRTAFTDTTAYQTAYNVAMEEIDRDFDTISQHIYPKGWSSKDSHNPVPKEHENDIPDISYSI